MDDHTALLIARVMASIVVVVFLSQKCMSSRSSSTSAPPTTGKAAVDVNTEYDRATIATHASVSDLWVIIDDKVYDLTEYADEHPGGAAALAKHAGGDATKGFKGPQHPSRVFDMVEDYRIGVVKPAAAR